MCNPNCIYFPLKDFECDKYTESKGVKRRKKNYYCGYEKKKITSFKMKCPRKKPLI